MEGFLTEQSTIVNTSIIGVNNSLKNSGGNNENIINSGGGCNALNQAQMDSELFAILCSIDKHNYLYLFERCKAFHINARQLLFLEKDHIRRIIPNDQVGILAEFEHLHDEWKRKQIPQTVKPVITSGEDNGSIPNIITPKILAVESIVANPSTKVSSNIADKSLNLKKSMVTDDLRKSTRRTSCRNLTYNENHSQMDDEDEESDNVELDQRVLHQFLLEKIIKKDLNRIRMNYERNGFLVERDRRNLAAVIVEYFISRNIHMNSDIGESMALQISEIFPTESKLSWHELPVGQRRRRGRLCLRYNNTLRSKRRARNLGKRRPKYRLNKEPPNTSEENANDVVDDSTNDVVEYNERYYNLQNWLKTNKYEDVNELLQMWQESSKYRLQQFKQSRKDDNHHAQAILEAWPAYKSHMGYNLLNIDFNQLQSLTDATFMERWSLFVQKVPKLYTLDLKDTTNLDLFTEYQSSGERLNEDTRYYILLYVLHTIVRPIRPVHPRQRGRRYPVTESQAAFCRLIKHSSEMDTFNEDTPFIFLIGSTFNVERCVLALKCIRYELSFKEAFYACFKFFKVFHLNFPLACLNFWTLCQWYFFDIKPDADTNIAVVEPTLKYFLETL